MNELNRLKAVERFKDLDSAITADLDEIVKLAAQLCKTPVALITLLDEDVQWFKVRTGVDIDSTDRKLAFCNYTIQQDDVMIVPDAAIDPRFTENSLVHSDPHVRFYAGAPLKTTEGHAIGSLCVVDLETRDLDDHQQQALKVLSKQVMNLMELNRSLHELKQRHRETEEQKQIIEDSELKLNAIFNSSRDTHVLVNKNLEILAFNNAAEAFALENNGFGLVTGDCVLDHVTPNRVKPLKKLFAAAFKGQTIKKEWTLNADTPQARWKEVVFVPIKNKAGHIIGVALNSTDITERKLQEDQINIQNAALTRIAIIQSHELRRPVASLLGIMALIKLEQSKAAPEYFDMLEITVKELDQKICEIVKDSEDTINNYMSIVA